MAMWSCPHCGTPQKETGRCWVCRRSSVCCATCRHIRTAVAGGLTYCGLDRFRRPIRGDEVRPCWEMANAVPEPNDRSNPAARPAVGAARDFVPVMSPVVTPTHAADPPPMAGAADGWTLFADVEL